VPLFIRWIHVLAAITWVGGMLFIALVLVPTVRALDDAPVRTRVIRDSGRRFRVVAWMALAILVLTGVLCAQETGGSLFGRADRVCDALAGAGRVHQREVVARPRLAELAEAVLAVAGGGYRARRSSG
jgi:uncharacterized membrane protein